MTINEVKNMSAGDLSTIPALPSVKYKIKNSLPEVLYANQVLSNLLEIINNISINVLLYIRYNIHYYHKS